MQVVLKQFSGLGNQLFQYAAARYYAHQLGATLRIAAEQEHRAKSLGSFDRPLLLPRFCIETPITPLRRLDRLLLSRSNLARFASPVARRFGIHILRETPEQQHTFIAPPTVPTARTFYIDGYWQAYQFAHAMNSELRQELRLRDAPAGANAAVLHSIMTAENPVSVHVRRGDYALLHGGQLVLPADYYRHAIELVSQRLTDPTLFVFSDDVEYARAMLPQHVATVYVEGNGDFAAQEDLRLMATCKAHIIANSSFSWWGAWLNPTKGKLVVAPKHWEMTTTSYYPSLCPPDWVLLDTAG